MLRDYQERAVTMLRESVKSGHKRPLMVLPTGGGKSHIYSQIISNVLENGKKVLWLVHRRNLVFQMRDMLEEYFDIHPGIIMSGVDSDLDNPAQLATIQTYHRRLQIADSPFNQFFVQADMILHDECHRSLSKTSQDILSHYDSKIVSGCTATPIRSDGFGMGEYYDDIIDVAGIKELTDQGHLVPARYFVPETIDLDGVKVSMGDYVIKELDEKVNKTKLIGNIVGNYLEHGEGRKALVYCVNVKHSMAVQEAFEKAGVNSAHLSARSNDDERDGVFEAMQRGDISVITNVALYIEGLNTPDVSYIAMARPSKSLGLVRQCLGRGLRPSDGKEDCLFFDHGNVIYEHGLLTEDIEWSLDGKKIAYSKNPKPREKEPVICRKCLEVFEGTSACPMCGTPVKTFSKKIDMLDAEMKEIKGKKGESTEAEKRIWFGMFLHHAKAKGYKNGWAFHKFQDKFKCKPGRDVSPIEPTQEFKNWMTHQNIKYAKSKKRKKVDPESSPLLNMWGIAN